MGLISKEQRLCQGVKNGQTFKKFLPLSWGAAEKLEKSMDFKKRETMPEGFSLDSAPPHPNPARPSCLLIRGGKEKGAEENTQHGFFCLFLLTFDIGILMVQ
jgi:hypothetical protein